MSGDAAVCPRCRGDKWIVAENGDHNSCPTCNGTGVVWRVQEAAGAAAGDDPTDLTYRR